MREIKFRAWIQKEKELCLVNEFKFDDFGNIYKIGWFTRKLGRPLFQDVIGHECSFIDLMQYTGLTDKNGKDVFEGDVVKYRYYSNNENDNRLAVVSYDNETCGFYPFCSKQDYDAKVEVLDVEVIGNVWENPELKNET